ncbi:MAG: hypothetical protein KGH63_00990 [Candidatus Micrarchaeota archaeon]|nr:hypothetical protein [Candidatus Micrarchaeota archaeon]
MGFFDAIGRGFSLTRASMRIAMREPWMMVLPLISGLLLVGLLASFILVPVLGGQEINDTYALIIVAVLYGLGYFLFYFTQAMIIFGAKERFAGRDPTFGQSFSSAAAHLPTIVLLTLIGATIGVITRALSGRDRNGNANIIGVILASLIGVAWTVVSYFSLPVILNEDKGVLESFKRSVELVTKSWGEGATANLSLLLLYVPAIILLALGFAGGLLLGSALLMAVGVGLGLLALLAAYAISIPVKAIVSQALYVYASTGAVPTGMEADHLSAAFAPKK